MTRKKSGILRKGDLINDTYEVQVFIGKMEQVTKPHSGELEAGELEIGQDLRLVGMGDPFAIFAPWREAVLYYSSLKHRDVSK